MEEVASLIADMVRAGVPADLIGRTAAALTSSTNAVDEQAARRREKDRERKQAARDAAKADIRPQTSADSADSADNTKTVSLSPIPLLSPTPPNNPLTPNPIQKPNSARGFRLPEDWILTGPDLAYALSKGFSEGQTGEMFEKFTNHWWSSTGKNAVKKDWHKAWRVWVLNELPRARAGPGRSPVRATTVYQQKQLADLEAINGLEDFAKRSGGSGSSDFEDRIGHSSARSESLLGGSGGPFIDISAPRREAGG